MTQVTPKALMQKALRQIFVPAIRAAGFEGRLPHFSRMRDTKRQMLMVMFNKYGGSFYVEAGSMTENAVHELQGHWLTSGKELTEAMLTVGHCPWQCRARLGGSNVSPDTDHWYTFGPGRLEEPNPACHPYEHYLALAQSATIATLVQAEEFFQRASP
jgi:hypothetical protein